MNNPNPLQADVLSKEVRSIIGDINTLLQGKNGIVCMTALSTLLVYGVHQMGMDRDSYLKQCALAFDTVDLALKTAKDEHARGVCNPTDCLICKEKA